MGSHIFVFLGGKTVLPIFAVRKGTRMFVLWFKSKVLFIQFKKWVNT